MKKKFTKDLLKCTVAVLFATTFVACGSKESYSAYDSNYTSGYESEYYADDYEVAEAAMYDGEGAGYMASNAKTGGGSTINARENSAQAPAEPNPSEDESAITGEMLVYRASMTLETLTYEDTLKAIREHIEKNQGIIENEYEYDNDNSWYYTDGRGRSSNRSISITLRVPTKNFNTFLNDMEGTAKVASRNQSVENIARRYSDNSIEIEALEKQQERLLEMMDKAQTIDEMVIVEDRLSEVQTELNMKKSYRSTMDTDVKYSTIDLTLKEVQKYTPVQHQGIVITGFWEKVVETVKDSWTYFVYFLEELALVLIRILPFALLIALVIYLIKLYRKSKGLDPRLFHFKKKTVKTANGEEVVETDNKKAEDWAKRKKAHEAEKKQEESKEETKKEEKALEMTEEKKEEKETTEGK